MSGGRSATTPTPPQVRRPFGAFIHVCVSLINCDAVKVLFLTAGRCLRCKSRTHQWGQSTSCYYGDNKRYVKVVAYSRDLLVPCDVRVLMVLF